MGECDEIETQGLGDGLGIAEGQHPRCRVGSVPLSLSFVLVYTDTKPEVTREILDMDCPCMPGLQPGNHMPPRIVMIVPNMK